MKMHKEGRTTELISENESTNDDVQEQIDNNVSDLNNHVSDFNNHVSDLNNHVSDFNNHASDLNSHVSDLKRNGSLLRLVGTPSLVMSTTDVFDSTRNGGAGDKQRYETVPRWRTKWEIEMRPSPNKTVKPTHSMSLSNLIDISLASDMFTTKQKTRRREKRRKSRFYRHGTSPLSDSDLENEKFERNSVKSTEVDRYNMLHKTWARSYNLCTQTQRLWKIDPKRKNKFLSNDAYLKDVNIVEKLPLPKDPTLNNRQRRLMRLWPRN